MKNDRLLFVLSLIMILSILIVILLVSFIMRFNQKKYDLVKKMRVSSDYQEYLSWRYKLRCHYLHLIPFVNEKNEMKVYNFIYNSKKVSKEERRSDGLYHILAPSMMAICACALYLCGTSWAWYSSTQASSVSSIISATYDADVAINVDGATSGVPKIDTISQMTLESGKEYKVTIKASGSATSGYCKVEVGNKVYYTNSIIPNDEYSFKIKANESCILKITPQWGTCAIDGQDVNENDLITYGTQSQSIKKDNVTETKKVTTTEEETATKPKPVIIENKTDVKEEVKEQDSEEAIVDSETEADEVISDELEVEEETTIEE